MRTQIDLIASRAKEAFDVLFVEYFMIRGHNILTHISTTQLNLCKMSETPIVLKLRSDSNSIKVEKSESHS